jgi:hypothetical protein
MGARVQNLDRLKRKLSRIPDGVKAAIREALQQNAEELVALQKRLLTTSEINIDWQFTLPGERETRGSVKGAEGMSVTVYAEGRDITALARWHEFGTAPGVREAPGYAFEHPGTSAQPYFYPAYRALRRRMKSRITRKQNQAIKRIAGAAQ